MKILYWAVLLDETSKERLLAFIPPIHPNIYAEHITLSFAPSELQNKKWSWLAGKKIRLKAQDYFEDEQGQAVSVSGTHRDDRQMPHITISCADGVKPVYSNELIKGKRSGTFSFELMGTFAARTNDGWRTDKEIQQEYEKADTQVSKK